MPARKCTYRENGRRCPFTGEGNPALCRAHQIALQEASRPKRPFEVVADAFVNFLQGKPINTEATIGAVDTLLGQWGSGMGADYRPDVEAGEGEDSVHRGGGRPRGAAPWSTWREAGQGPRPGHADPEAEERRRIELAARQVMGFTASEILTEDQIRDRKKTLARRFHPDRRGGSLEQMKTVNAAADILLQSIAPTG